MTAWRGDERERAGHTTQLTVEELDSLAEAGVRIPEREDGYPVDWDRRRRHVYRRDGYRCRNCGARRGEAELHAHHVVPKSEGGSHHTRNLVTLCAACHDDAHPTFSIGATPSTQTRLDDVPDETQQAVLRRLYAETDVSAAELETYADALGHRDVRRAGDASGDSDRPGDEATGDTARPPVSEGRAVVLFYAAVTVLVTNASVAAFTSVPGNAGGPGVWSVLLLSSLFAVLVGYDIVTRDTTGRA